jgi:hypothetical protein
MTTTYGSATSRSGCCAGVCLVSCLVLLGCADGRRAGDADWHKSGQIANAPTESDIVRVFPVYDPVPWLVRQDDDSGQPIGIRVSAVYLISDRTSKGVFGDGLLRMVLYRITYRPGAETVRTRVNEWQFDSQQAVAWRVTKPSWMGYGYQFDLVWPDDLDLPGCEIALAIEYVRTDGRVVRSTPKHFKVPTGI